MTEMTNHEGDTNVRGVRELAWAFVAQEEWPEMCSASGLMVVVAAALISRELRGSGTS